MALWLHWIPEGSAGWLFYGLFRLLPPSWCSALGAQIGRYQGLENSKIWARVNKNLDWINPKAPRLLSSVSANQILRQSGRCYFESMIADRLVAGSQVDMALSEQIEASFSKGTPIIFVTVHIANLGDLMSASLSRLLFRDYGYLYGASPTRPIANKLLQFLAKHIRNNYLRGTPGHSSSPNVQTARDYVRALQRPKSFVIFHLDEARL